MENSGKLALFLMMLFREMKMNMSGINQKYQQRLDFDFLIPQLEILEALSVCKLYVVYL